MKKLTGKLTIGKYSGSRDESPVFINVTDAVSGCRFLEIGLSLKDFSEALFGRGDTSCTFEIVPDAPIGMRAEHKTETVSFNCWGKKSDDQIFKALAPFEVEGWKGRAQDLVNGHCRVADGKQRVTFFRHVNPETEEPIL